MPAMLVWPGAWLMLPQISGYDPVPTPFATPALSPKTPLVTLKGVPVWKLTMPESSHPPSVPRSTRAGMLEEWQVIDIAAGKNVTLIEVGTGARPLQVVRIYKSPIVSIR